MDKKLKRSPIKIENGRHYPRFMPNSTSLHNTNQLDFLLGVTDFLLKDQLSEHFREPVDTVKCSIPDYFNIIRKPMDIGTIKNRLVNYYYRSADKCIRNYRTMFNNCYTFNPSADWIYQECQALERLFDEKLKNMPKEEVETPLRTAIPHPRIRKLEESSRKSHSASPSNRNSHYIKDNSESFRKSSRKTHAGRERSRSHTPSMAGFETTLSIDHSDKHPNIPATIVENAGHKTSAAHSASTTPCGNKPSVNSGTESHRKRINLIFNQRPQLTQGANNMDTVGSRKPECKISIKPIISNTKDSKKIFIPSSMIMNHKPPRPVEDPPPSMPRESEYQSFKKETSKNTGDSFKVGNNQDKIQRTEPFVNQINATEKSCPNDTSQTQEIKRLDKSQPSMTHIGMMFYKSGINIERDVVSILVKSFQTPVYSPSDFIKNGQNTADSSNPTSSSSSGGFNYLSSTDSEHYLSGGSEGSHRKSRSARSTPPSIPEDENMNYVAQYPDPNPHAENGHVKISPRSQEHLRKPTTSPKECFKQIVHQETLDEEPRFAPQDSFETHLDQEEGDQSFESVPSCNIKKSLLISEKLKKFRRLKNMSEREDEVREAQDDLLTSVFDDEDDEEDNDWAHPPSCQLNNTNSNFFQPQIQDEIDPNSSFNLSEVDED